jgi:hypothetical protein
MPPASRPWTSALDALKCPSPDCIITLVWQGKYKCHLQINNQGPLLPRASHQHSHPPGHQLHPLHQQRLTESPDLDNSILAPAEDQIPEESISDDDSLYKHILEPDSSPQESNLEEADCRETPIDKENPEIEVYLMAGRGCVDDPDFNGFGNLINILLQPIYCTTEIKLAIRFIKTHYPNSQIVCHFSVGECEIPEHVSYTSRWTIYFQILTMDNQLPTLGEACISTQHGQRFVKL